MTYQALDLGTSADDGTGDSLRLGGDKLNDNFSELYTLLGTGSTLTTGISATGSVVTLTSAVGTFTTLTPASADGASLGSASLEFSDIYLYDSSVIYFGIDSEITLTHVHNVGLTLTHVTADDNLPIVLQLKSEEDAIVADEVIASIEFAAGDSDGTDGATVAAGIHAIAEGTFSASANATKLVFTTGVSETAASSATAKMTLSSAGLLTIADDFMIKDGGTIGVASTNDALTISSAGLLTVKDDLVIKTGGTIGGANDTDLLTLTSAVLTVAGEVVGTGFTGTLDGILGSGTAAAATTTTLASTTITASGIIKTDDTTAATSTTDGSLQTDGGLSVAGDAVIGDDLLLLSDAAVLSFGANSEVTLTHVHNDGLLLNSDNQLQFRDSAINIRSDADGDLDINADDEIELNSTLIDVNGNLDVSGTIVSAGVITGTAFTAGSAVLAEAELELLDGLTAGTAIASKVVTTDASIDTTGQRNLTISGELDAATGDFSGAVDVAGATTTAAITASGIIKTDDTTAATSTTDGSLQTDGGLSVVLDAVIGDDIIMISDAAQIAFGVNSEITLAHVHNVGLTLTHVTADDNLPIVLQLKSEEDAIIADEVIGSLEFAAGDSDGTDGATVAAGIHAIAEDTFSASANATKLVFTTGVSETAASSATAKMTLSSAGLLTVKDDLVIKTGGTIGGANDTDLLTLTSDVLTVAGEVVGTGFTGTLDGVLGGGAAAAATTTTLASTTITASGIIKTDDTTAATSTTDGSLQTDGGLSVALDAVIGDDLIMLSDAAVMHFGTNSEVTLTHVHDVGLNLKHTATADDKPIILTLQTGETDMAANDVMGKLAFQAPDEGTGTDAVLVAAAIQARAEGDFSASSNATSLDFMTGSSEAAATKMTLSSAGALTIGTAGGSWNGAANGRDFTVHGGSETTTGVGQISVQATDAFGANLGGGISFGGEYSAGDNIDWATLWGRKENATDDNTAGYMQFNTRVNGGNMTERMRITSTGLLGIGTTAPASLLEIKAAALNRANGISVVGSGANDILYIYPSADNVATIEHLINGSTSTGGVLAINPQGGNVGIGTTAPTAGFDFRTGLASNSQFTINASSTAGSGAGGAFLKFHGSNAASAPTIAGIDGSMSDGTDGSESGMLAFFTTNSGTSAEKMRINSNGTIGIAVTAISDVQLGMQINSQSWFAVFESDDGTDQFRIASTGNVTNTNNSYGAISDIKLKENITAATPKLADLMQVKICNFNFIGDTTKQIGVIAQELETVFPGMVDDSPDPGSENNDLGTTTKSVKYSVFVPILIKAMQEQQATIEALTARITTLEG